MLRKRETRKTTFSCSSYRTTKHATTRLSPYEVQFGSNPPSLYIPNLPSTLILDPLEYSANLKSKVLKLRESVDANLVQSADKQQQSTTVESQM